MIDYRTTLVAELSTILPTYYELMVDSNTETPCITYTTVSDYHDLESDNHKYSRITYQIKLWGSSLQDLSNYTLLLDDKMFQLGFQRIGYNELTYKNQIQMIFRYQALFEEKLQS